MRPPLSGAMKHNHPRHLPDLPVVMVLAQDQLILVALAALAAEEALAILVRDQATLPLHPADHHPTEANRVTAVNPLDNPMVELLNTANNRSSHLMAQAAHLTVSRALHLMVHLPLMESPHPMEAPPPLPMERLLLMEVLLPTESLLPTALLALAVSLILTVQLSQRTPINNQKRLPRITRDLHTELPVSMVSVPLPLPTSLSNPPMARAPAPMVSHLPTESNQLTASLPTRSPSQTVTEDKPQLMVRAAPMAPLPLISQLKLPPLTLVGARQVFLTLLR